jgi:hypothetical protein
VDSAATAMPLEKERFIEALEGLEFEVDQQLVICCRSVVAG